ncbi:MAG: hypothetical protein JWM99_2774, partial [Verrucomicrobiales bacterium]|nr:hypothetical protein [Verrucomicrobiales bacterium]
EIVGELLPALQIVLEFQNELIDFLVPHNELNGDEMLFDLFRR